ncbi:MAG: mechanosensitive ion channel family protein [Pseudomonadota bacterium]
MERRGYIRMMRNCCQALLLLLVAMAATAAPAQTIFNAGTGDDGEVTAPEIPEDLSPEVIDGLMSRLTDADVRNILREELIRRAETQAAEEKRQADPTLANIEARLMEMTMEISDRVSRWTVRIANLDERLPEVRKRLATASLGLPGMIAAIAGLVAAGVAAALLTAWFTQSWRQWLRARTGLGYWMRFACSNGMLALEILPIIAFVYATRGAAVLLADLLGPLSNMIWIYYIGIQYAWGAIVFARRTLAPEAPGLRMVTLPDIAARQIHRLLRRATLIGLTGWLLGGAWFHLGFGFPPALVTVALSGIGVSAVLLTAILRNRQPIRSAIYGMLAESDWAHKTRMFLAAMSPIVLAGFVLLAGLYWLAHWLERGQHRLEGPLGTMIVLLLLPMLDRFGREVISAVFPVTSDARQRLCTVLNASWRVATGLIGFLIIAALWGVDVFELAKGENAPVWADAAFDIAVTVLIGLFLWHFVKAILYTEAASGTADEDVDPANMPKTSRLTTLLPLFRSVLLIILISVVVMMVLTKLGVDIGPLLASAGIIGIAIGFGAQTLVRDIFSGIFFLIDDAFRVGEYIELDKDLRGEVQAISVRSLQLRHHRGPVITIPFGELKNVTNHNRDWVIYKMSFRLEPETDPHKVKKIVKEVGKEFWAHPDHGPKFLEPLKSQGVYFIDDDSALVIRVKFKCLPRAQFVLRREIYHRLRTVFAEQDIRFARRKVEVVGSDDAKAIEGGVALSADDVASDGPGTTP